MNLKTILLSVLLLSFLFAFPQRNCGTMQHHEDQLIKDPSLSLRMQDQEREIKNWIQKNINKQQPSIITIPVVVHIVYNNTNENISDNQIFSQLDILNEDFRRLNADSNNTPIAFRSVAADCNIEFCLANKDPNGNTTTGITRTQTSLSSFGTNNDVKFTSSGGVDAWNTNEYLNIWVIFYPIICNI